MGEARNGKGVRKDDAIGNGGRDPGDDVFGKCSAGWQGELGTILDVWPVTGVLSFDIAEVGIILREVDKNVALYADGGVIGHLAEDVAPLCLIGLKHCGRVVLRPAGQHTTTSKC